jgi:DisA bacterial checkpoint controller nucleotide-binding
VHLAAATGALVLQRLGRGWVRLTTPHGVTTWDGIHWSAKPLAAHIAARLRSDLADADPTVLANLVEFATHWLGAGRVGATLVWRLDGDPRQLDQIGLAATVDIPPLELTRRAHFAPLLNALSQYDRAALVDARGRVTTVGVHLRTSEHSRQEIAPYRGTRHTSALRFSADEPSAVVVVVSSSGPLSVFWRGRRLDT